MPAIPAHGLVKGHGTGNDFLLYADPEARHGLSRAEIAGLTDRHQGLGADGLIRAVRPSVLAHEENAAAIAARTPGVEWFMDYRNADGSLAEMCGNGIRVFAAFLRAEGLLDLPDGASTPIGTRAGVREVRREGEDYAVDMGLWSAPGGAEALAAGYDASVALPGLPDARPGLRIAMPNPHVVVAVSSPAELEAVDFAHAPRVAPEPPEGTNVEAVLVLGEQQLGAVGGDERVGVLRMRVHERGVGETLSCGTGACAAALAVRAWGGPASPSTWVVSVPGGQLLVRVLPGSGGEHVELSGPARLVGRVLPLDAG